MPPRGHSSSHHHSSHHSSHSSSHHSSSRSHSSHSSSHHSSSFSSWHSSFGSGRSSCRTRSSQPYGWHSTSSATIRFYHCVSHDYNYYPEDWTAEDGKSFEAGYYDENGQHYNNVLIVGSTTMLRCAYCGNRMVYQWKEGNLPTCDRCGAQFEIDITDTAEVESDRATWGVDESVKRTFSEIHPIGKLAIGVMVAAALLPLFMLFGAVVYTITSVFTSNEPEVRNESVQNSIYVEEIGRTCYQDGEDWYDSQTECWFYFNDGQWQYWYEGISSDYGDYGWMEYDMDESAWYIEVENGQWVHLPETYDTTNLWHMNDEFVNEL